MLELYSTEIHYSTVYFMRLQIPSTASADHETTHNMKKYL